MINRKVICILCHPVRVQKSSGGSTSIGSVIYKRMEPEPILVWMQAACSCLNKLGSLSTLDMPTYADSALSELIFVDHCIWLSPLPMFSVDDFERQTVSRYNQLIINIRQAGWCHQVVQELPDKQCFLDSLSTWLLKANVRLLAPFLCRLFNWSLQHGTVPSSMKQTWTYWLGLSMGWVGLGLGRIFEISVGWIGLGQARTTSYNSITPSKRLDTSFYDFNMVLEKSNLFAIDISTGWSKSLQRPKFDPSPHQNPLA